MTKKQSYILSFFLFSLLTFIIIIGDYFVTQKFSSDKDFKKTEKRETQAPKDNLRVPIVTKTPSSQNISQIKNKKYFQKIKTEIERNSKIKLSINPPYSNSFIFKIFPINRIENNMSLSTIEIREKINNTHSREYLRIYEINFYDENINNAYRKLKESIENELKNNIEAKVVEVNKYGKKSFVIRLEKNQKTMYLVLASDDRLLGIEYSLGENFSRHRSIDTVLQSVFPLERGK